MSENELALNSAVALTVRSQLVFLVSLFAYLTLGVDDWWHFRKSFCASASTLVSTGVFPIVPSFPALSPTLDRRPVTSGIQGSSLGNAFSSHFLPAWPFLRCQMSWAARGFGLPAYSYRQSIVLYSTHSSTLWQDKTFLGSFGILDENRGNSGRMFITTVDADNFSLRGLTSRFKGL